MDRKGGKVPGRVRAESAWKGKGGKCLEVKGRKVPGREKAESAWKGKGGKCLEGKGWKVPEKVKGGKCLDGKGRKVPGWERVESVWKGKGRKVPRNLTHKLFSSSSCVFKYLFKRFNELNLCLFRTIKII